MNIKNISLKVGNMKKEQEFTLYPYKGGDTIYLQSDKRFIIANLRTGAGRMNAKGCDYPNSIKLSLNPLDIQLPADTITELQDYLWHNNGKDGNVSGVLHFENKELFSVVTPIQ